MTAQSRAERAPHISPHDEWTRKIGATCNVFIVRFTDFLGQPIEMIRAHPLVRPMPTDKEMSDTPLPNDAAAPVLIDPDRRAFRRALFDRPVMIETEAES